MNFLYLIGGILTIVLIALSVFLIILKLKEEERPQDNSHFYNFMPQYANGHIKGIINRVIYGDKKVAVEFFPRDIDYVKLFKNKIKAKLKPELVFYEKRKLIPLGKGLFSDHKNEIWGLPPNPEDFPEVIKNNIIGAGLMEENAEINLKNHEITVLRGDAEGVRIINKREVDNEHWINYLKAKDELHRDDLKSMAKEEKRGFPAPTKIST